MEDMIIIGGGPAGITAAIYGLRANKNVLVLEKEGVGGKIITSPFIENYPGIMQIDGITLAENLQKQVKQLGGKIKNEEVIGIKQQEDKKQVITKQEKYDGKSVIIATGTMYKKLEIAKEEELIGKGISFCATCDGFFYRNKTVAVVGGGNTAVTNALELSNICQKVYLIQVLDHLTAEPILINRLKERQNIEFLYQTSVKRIIGEESLTGIEIERKGKREEMVIQGLFLSIGQIPETKLVKGMIQMNHENYIMINENGMTNQKGIFAAGDCVNKKVRQLTTAINDGTIAALSAIEYIDHLS